MKKFWQIYFVIIGVAMLFGLAQVPQAFASDSRQQPTVSIPTVTGTATGPIVRVNSDQDQVNVRSGPSTDLSQSGGLDCRGRGALRLVVLRAAIGFKFVMPGLNRAKPGCMPFW